MITGTHALIHSDHAEEIRAFFRHTLKLPHVDAGHGWLIFSLPPAEIGMHPQRREATTNSTYCATTSIPRSPISKSAA